MWRAVTVFLAFSVPAGAAAQAELPLVEGASPERLRDHAHRLLQALDALKAPLPAETTRAVQALLREKPADNPDLAVKIQKLLDPHCLIGVGINPQSRVKAARGPAVAGLRQDQEVVVLVKVHNDAGVTQALAVAGPQLRTGGRAGRDQWLEAAVYAKPPLGKALSGDKVEYVVLRLTAREAGKREATLKFDVGQGTQDLGFRAEVPVLFTVKPAK
jgi:hypothetical protein